MTDTSHAGPETGDAFLVRMLVKTSMKAVIWSVMALAVTWFWPEASWIWFVVLAFVLIGVGAGVVGRFMINRAARKPSPPSA